MPAPHVPALACDAHLHVYDARFAHVGGLVDDATAEDYALVRGRLGTERAVVVTPRNYGVDNRVTLDAIRRLGTERTRGVAVLHPDVADAELEALHAAGVRGVRFSLYTPEQAAVGFEMVEPLAFRVAALGWHVQLHWNAAQIVEHAQLLSRLRAPVVFDHFARLPLPGGIAHPAFNIVRRLLDDGLGWVKLTAPYLDSRMPGHEDMASLARAYVHLAPDRCVWGSDWPHPTQRADKPDDTRLFDLLADWTQDEAQRHRILVDNPAQLYDF